MLAHPHLHQAAHIARLVVAWCLLLGISGWPVYVVWTRFGEDIKKYFKKKAVEIALPDCPYCGVNRGLYRMSSPWDDTLRCRHCNQEWII